MNHALPQGTRLRGGALLIEELLRREEKAFIYRAYDVPERCTVTLIEFFPDGATRLERIVQPPGGWSTQGLAIARERFLQNYSEATFIFEENDTLYVAQEYFAPPLKAAASVFNNHATVPLSPLTIVPAQTLTSPNLAREDVDTSSPASASPARRQQFSWLDVLPDAISGAKQGAIAGVIGGVLLGAFASLFGEGEIMGGALRGLWGLPIGAIAGALLGALRALPSSASQLATTSARTRKQQLQSTLSGAGKGALLGFLLGLVFLIFAAISGMELPLFTLLRAAILLTLSGAFSGAIVGFIRVMPRDRSRR